MKRFLLPFFLLPCTAYSSGINNPLAPSEIIERQELIAEMLPISREILEIDIKNCENKIRYGFYYPDQKTKGYDKHYFEKEIKEIKVEIKNLYNQGSEYWRQINIRDINGLKKRVNKHKTILKGRKYALKSRENSKKEARLIIAGFFRLNSKHYIALCIHTVVFEHLWYPNDTYFERSSISADYLTGRALGKKKMQEERHRALVKKKMKETLNTIIDNRLVLGALLRDNEKYEEAKECYKNLISLIEKYDYTYIKAEAEKWLKFCKNKLERTNLID